MRWRRPSARAHSRALLLAVTAAAAVVYVSTEPTLSSWTTAAVAHSDNSVGTGQVTVTHSNYTGGPCVGTPRTAVVPCRGALAPNAAASTADQITNTSTGAVGPAQALDLLSCAPVELANSNRPADALLARGAVTFAATGGPTDRLAGSGAIAFGPSGYAAGINAQTLGGTLQGILLGTTSSYGYGIWLRTTDADGRIFGLGTATSLTPSTGGAPAFDRTLTLTAGHLSFAAAGAPTATTSITVNDGQWHSVYVAITTRALSVLGIGIVTTTTSNLYVDGLSAATATNGGLIGVPLPAVTGYWFVGPNFVGSLSNFVVYNSGNAVTTALSSASYSSADEWWKLDDTGYGTYTGTLVDPCSKVTVTFSFTGPSQTVGPLTLSELVAQQPQAIAAPGNGQTQGLAISVAGAYPSDYIGLRLYVPISFIYTSTAGSWSQELSWTNSPDDVFEVP